MCVCVCMYNMYTYVFTYKYVQNMCMYAHVFMVSFCILVFKQEKVKTMYLYTVHVCSNV